MISHLETWLNLGIPPPNSLNLATLKQVQHEDFVSRHGTWHMRQWRSGLEKKAKSAFSEWKEPDNDWYNCYYNYYMAWLWTWWELFSFVHMRKSLSFLRHICPAAIFWQVILNQYVSTGLRTEPIPGCQNLTGDLEQPSSCVVLLWNLWPLSTRCPRSFSMSSGTGKCGWVKMRTNSLFLCNICHAHNQTASRSLSLSGNSVHAQLWSNQIMLLSWKLITCLGG